MLVGSADILIIMFLGVSLFKQRIVRDRSAAMLHTPTESVTSCSVPRRDGVAAATTAIATLLGNDHPHWERPRLMHPEPLRDERDKLRAWNAVFALKHVAAVSILELTGTWLHPGAWRHLST